MRKVSIVPGTRSEFSLGLRPSANIHVDESLQTAYFRGRRLRGRRIAIPEGYQGTTPHLVTMRNTILTWPYRNSCAAY
jgi:hypothetical protein